MESLARSDDELLQEAREGNREAFGELHARLARPAHAFAYRVCGSADLAADVVQEAFIELLNGARGYRFDGRLRPYLLRMIANSLYSFHRSLRAQTGALRPAPPDPPPDAVALRSLTAEAAWRALRRLSHAERVVVILRACHGLRFREIADVLVESETAVKTRYHRALQRLRRMLADWGDTS
jgi:RNA polymerase sigma-70 factor (ECF subfamily)